MISNKKIAVVIPCFKVSRQINEVLVSLPKFIDDVIVVDDACPEKSGNISKKLKQDNIQVIFHKKNKGEQWRLFLARARRGLDHH